MAAPVKNSEQRMNPILTTTPRITKHTTTVEKARGPRKPHVEVRGIPHPRFPVKASGFRETHAPFLKERRTRCLVQCNVQEIRGISQKTSEIWGTRGFVVGTNFNDTGISAQLRRAVRFLIRCCSNARRPSPSLRAPSSPCRC